MRIILLFAPILLLLAGCASEQKKEARPTEVSKPYALPEEESLVKLFRAIEETDSLPDEYADTFKVKLLTVLRDSTTFSYPFDSLAAVGIRIVESDDRRARIYWWLHPHSGTFRHYPAIVQYLKSDGTFHVKDLDPDDEGNDYAALAYRGLYHIADSLYLGISVGQIWSGAPYETVLPVIFSESGSGRPKLTFHVGDSIFTSIWLDKNWYHDHMEQFGNTIPLLTTYDSASRILTFPAIIDTKTGEIYNDVLGHESVRPSGDTIRLRFNGKFFEEVPGNAFPGNVSK